MLNQILTHLLYAFSGFFFAVSACRYSVIAIRKIRQQLAVGDRQLAALYIFCTGVFIILTWAALPLFLYSRSQTAGFVFLATLLFFFSRAHRNGSLKP